jgi:hypothetical protein
LIKPKLKERKIRTGEVIAILSSVVLLLNFSAVQGVQEVIQVESDEIKGQVPDVYCLYENREYKMKPFIYKSDGGDENMISYPDLPDHVSPVISLEKGETMTIRSDEEPKDMTAYLVDYEGDTTETYALEEEDNNTFKLEPAGLQTFEVHAKFLDGRDISYTVLTEVLESN